MDKHANSYQGNVRMTQQGLVRVSSGKQGKQNDDGCSMVVIMFLLSASALVGVVVKLVA